MSEPAATESPRPATRDRVTAAAKGRATRARRARATGYRKGDTARTSTPRSPRFHDRVGTVVDINHGEVGLTFTGTGEVAAWFLPAELTHAG